MSDGKHFKDLVATCGDHLLTGLRTNNFTGIASFSLAMDEYIRNGSSHFTTILTVHIMKHITERTEIPGNDNMKIVAQVHQKNNDVFVNFRWLTAKMKTDLKKTNPRVVELCWICKLNKPARDFKRCGVCRNASYCSVECQRISWPEHKKECKSAPFKTRKL